MARKCRFEPAFKTSKLSDVDADIENAARLSISMHVNGTMKRV